MCISIEIESFTALNSFVVQLKLKKFMGVAFLLELVAVVSYYATFVLKHITSICEWV